MRKMIVYLLCLLTALSLSNNINAQTTKAWISIPTEAAVPYYTSDSSLVSNDVTFNQYIQSLGIFSSRQALPASRNPLLQQVYEIQCHCTLNELKSTLTQMVPSVTQVEKAPQYDTLHTPNDYSLSLGVNNYALNLINAQQAWDITTGNPNVIIAISDQDYSANHSELVGKYVHLYQGGATPTHGNAVSILAAGNTNNNNGLSSIGYDCKLGLYTMNYNEVLTAAYAGHRIINMSWSSGCFYNPYEQLCVTEAYEAGAFLVAAAGNGVTCGGAWNMVYPAAYDHVFSVTSIGQSDNHIQFGNDTTNTHQHNDRVDLSAPGYGVAVNPIEGWYFNSSGTSFAAPYVSGTAGLMLSINPCLSRKDIDSILRLSSVNIDALNPAFTGKIGAGRLNAFAAVQMAQNWTTQPMTVTAQPANAYTLPGGNAQYTVSSSSSLPLYQWQYDSSGVFVNLVNNATYSGVKTATLTITNASNSLNNEQYRCVMQSGLCQAISNAASLFITNNIILPDSAGVITPPNVICLGDTVQFSIAPVNNATGYNWTVSGNSTIVSGQNTTTISISPADTAFVVTVTPTNSYGSGASASFSVNLGPIATAAFSGGATICLGDTASLTINFTGNGPFSGWINGNIPFSTAGNSVSITVSPTQTTDYILTDLIAGQCPGAPDYFSTMATVSVIPPVYDTIQQVVCSGQLPYLWQGLSLNTTGFYNDTLVATTGCDSVVTLHLVVLAGNAPAAPSFLTQTLVSNTCNARIYRYTAAITNNTIGYQWTIPITCGGGGPILVDSGDINSSRIIRLKYLTNNAAFITDSIWVRAYNSCGNGPKKSAKLINLALTPPARPLSITVTPLITNVCNERRYRYSAPPLPQAGSSTAAATGYIWSFSNPIPLQAIIDSGTVNSQTIVVKYPSNAATSVTDSIYVAYTSACGNSPNRGLRISMPALNTPAAPGSITITAINNNTCGNRTYRLTMPVYPTVGLNQVQPNGYQWTLTGNVALNSTIDSGSLTSRIIVIRYTSDNNTVLGDSIKAQYNSICGLGATRAVKFSIPKLNPPLAPGFITITPIQTTVCGNRIYRYAAPSLPGGTSAYAPATAYEWSFTGALGSNAVLDSGTLTGKIIRVSYTSNAAATAGDSVRLRYSSSCGFGLYRASKLTNNVLSGCPPVTAKFNASGKSTESFIYPNPVQDKLNIQLEGIAINSIIGVYNANGVCMITRRSVQGNNQVDVSKLPAGVYMIRVFNANGKTIQSRFVKY
ncbi:MAG: S8 family serine peptidase [Ferruginibacter sp.]